MFKDFNMKTEWMHHCAVADADGMRRKMCRKLDIDKRLACFNIESDFDAKVDIKVYTKTI